MIKVNTHLSTEITDRRIRLSTKKYPFFSRTTWENYSSVYPLEYTCISISVSISCSHLFYIHVSFLFFLQPKSFFFLLMANSMGADDDFFLHILHYKLSTLRNNYIIFKKKIYFNILWVQSCAYSLHHSQYNVFHNYCNNKFISNS